MNSLEQENWDVELTPKNNMFDLKIRDEWHYRNLLAL